MKISKPDRSHIYTCHLDTLSRDCHDDHKHQIEIGFQQYSNEPGFKVLQLPITDLEIINVPIEGYEHDDRLTKQNHYLSFNIADIQTHDNLFNFLTTIGNILITKTKGGQDIPWVSTIDDRGFYKFKIETGYEQRNEDEDNDDQIPKGDWIYLRETQETKFVPYSGTKTDLKNLFKNKKHNLANILVYRMYDFISKKFHWVVYQIGIIISS